MFYYHKYCINEIKGRTLSIKLIEVEYFQCLHGLQRRCLACLCGEVVRCKNMMLKRDKNENKRLRFRVCIHLSKHLSTSFTLLIGGRWVWVAAGNVCGWLGAGASILPQEVDPL